MAGRSINAHAKAWSLQYVGGHMPIETMPQVTGQALRQHIQIFRRKHVIGATPETLAVFERMIAEKIAFLSA